MVWAQSVSLGHRHDDRAALAEVDAPVLVLHGTDDLQSEAASRLYADAFPNATLATISSAGHFAFDEKPTAFAHSVEQFLAQLSPEVIP